MPSASWITAEESCEAHVSLKQHAHLVIIDREAIARRRGAQPSRLGAQAIAQPRDVDLDRLDGAERLVVGPQFVGQQRGGDRPIALQKQQREHAPLTGSPKIQSSTVSEDCELAEEAEFELHVGTRASCELAHR